MTTRGRASRHDGRPNSRGGWDSSPWPKDQSGTCEGTGTRGGSMSTCGRGMLALIMLAGSFALLTVLARYLNTGFTIAQQVYLRAAAASVITGTTFRRRIRWRLVPRTRPREWLVVSSRAVLLYAVGATLFSKAATLSLISDVSFIAALPVVSILALLLRRVTLTRRRLLCVTGSVIGVAAVSLHVPGRGIHLPVWDSGDLLALLGVLSIALSLLGRSEHDGTLNNAEITFLILAVGASCVAIASFTVGQGLPRLAQNGPLWGAIVLAGTLNALNVFLINYGFEHVDPVRAGNLITLEAVWGLTFGLVFYHQWPTALELVGGAVIVGCALGLNSALDRHAVAPLPNPDDHS